MERATAVVWSTVRGVRPLFYLEPPSSSSFKEISEVPDYLDRVSRVSDGDSDVSRGIYWYIHV